MWTFYIKVRMGAFYIKVRMGTFYVKVRMWTFYIKVRMGAFLSKLECGPFILKLEWGPFILKLEWGPFILKLEWGGPFMAIISTMKQMNLWIYFLNYMCTILLTWVSIHNDCSYQECIFKLQKCDHEIKLNAFRTLIC